jgi:hypothetical protein
MMSQFLAKLPILMLTLLVGTIASSSVFGSSNIVIQNGDPSGVGFNDPTPASPVSGNNGTTLGQQRLNAFQHAANIWGTTLNSGPTITVRATWEELTCDSSSGVLGSAGALGIWRNFPGAPASNTWYSSALANALSGSDLDPGNPEIRARFNVRIGSPGCLESRQWYLGLDTNHGTDINLVTVLLHEFSHGLGFQTFTDKSSGAMAQGVPSVYDRFLYDNSNGKTWVQMNDSERVASAINTGNLAWSGPHGTTDATGVLTGGTDSQGRPLLHAPNPLASGSSVSHWDRNASPNQLMEPNISTSLSHNVMAPYDLTASLLSDIGWSTDAALPQPLPPTPTPTPDTIQLSATNFIAEEGSGVAQVTVTRSNTSAAATVDYATSDNAGLNGCHIVNGIGSSRCDYAHSVGKLSFAVGEASKTIMIALVDDGYAEGSEDFAVTLTGAVGATLGSVVTANVTIQDNESANGSNPIDTADFFIRQHYIDFLGRNADPAGLEGWRNVLNNCGITVAQPCDRIEVSAGFFRSPEFQQRGYFVYRFYSAVGKIPLYSEFVPDLAKVSGFLSDDQLEATKAAFVHEFMARPDFQNRYGSTLNNPNAYVDALLQTVGLPNHPARETWLNLLNASNTLETRGQVLRSLVESGEVYTRYYNEAFVIMQYFGYLRRTADASYLNWIETMNQTGGDYRIMINGFMNSTEYRQRFGPE